jgi:hypothetical protein
VKTAKLGTGRPASSVIAFSLKLPDALHTVRNMDLCVSLWLHEFLAGTKANLPLSLLLGQDLSDFTNRPVAVCITTSVKEMTKNHCGKS